MLRVKLSVLTVFPSRLCVLAVAFLLVTVLSLIPQGVSSSAGVVRLTHTVAQAVNLNPSLSDDGRVVVFESSADFFAGGLNDGFHAIRVNVSGGPPEFHDFAASRLVSPSLSSDGGTVVFASRDDLVGDNFDRNSEVYLLNGSGLKQITHSSAETHNTQPSVSADGRLISFLSAQNLLLFDVQTKDFSLLADDEGASNPKISGDGSKLYYQRGRDLVLLDLKSNLKRIVARDMANLSIGVGRVVSHDGTRLVYSAEPVENQSQVFLFDLRDETNRQLTELGSRATDVNLQPTISGDGKRVAFATRRRVLNTSDGSVELYLYDVPTGQTQQITNAPASATAPVVSSLNFDGSVIAFSFARVLSGPVGEDFENNSEIYLASPVPRPQFGAATVFNAAAQGNEPSQPASIAPGSIATIRGSALAFKTQSAVSADPPLELAGTAVKINGHTAPIFLVSPEEVVFVVPEGVADGPAEVVATNSDGFSSKAQIVIASAAPGIFTVNGDGEGEAIILDADSQTAAPFDPSNGRLRLSIFATGLSHAQNVAVIINGQPLTVETVVSSGAVMSSGLRGLNEIRVLVPAELRGAGTSTLSVTAEGVQSNPVTVTLGGSALRDIVINELLADPPDGLAGDANRDGVRDSADDEFVELVNSTAHDLDLSGYQLQTRTLTAVTDTVRHRFAPGTILPGGGAIVIFGGGSPDANNSVFGGSQIVTASSGGLSLTNSGGIITVRNTEGGIITRASYGTVLNLRADQNQSLTRSPDIFGDLALHSTVSTNLFSPGTKSDNSVFIGVPPPTPTPTPTPTVTPIPSPSPTATPIPTPTATPIPSPSPTATPIPTPTTSPTPEPTPTATPTPNTESQIVISHAFGGGGNTNAPYRNDFIELFNRGNAPIDLTGWTIQYAGTTSSSWSVTPLTPTTLAPGQYYLVQQAAGANNGIALPQPDATGTIAMASAAGKVALVKTTTALTGPCPTDPNIIDLVGYGSTASCFKGSAPAPAASNTNAITRKSDGCTDTNNNSADFITATPTPRNIASPVNICPQPTAANNDAQSSPEICSQSTVPDNCTQSTARFEILRFTHGLAHRHYHFPSRTLRLRQLPRRPT